MRSGPAERPSTRDLFGADAGEVWRLLVAFLGGPTAWSLHLGVCYLAATIECATGWGGSDMTIVIATAVLGAAAAATGVMAYRTWRRRDPDARVEPALGSSRGARELLLVIGMVFAALSVLAIVLAGVVPFFVPTCS